MTTNAPNRDLITPDKNAEALLNAKIKRVNQKTIGAAVIGTAILDLFTIPLGPTFNDVWFLIGWASFVSFMAFAILYQIFFYFLGRDVVEAAKKRGKYLVQNAHQDTSPSGPDLMFDIEYRHLSFNLYNRDH